MSTTRLEMIYCHAPVEGRTYQELDARARQYAANFFEVPIESVKIVMAPQPVVTKLSKHAEEAVPEVWAATFRVGTLKEVDEIDAADDGTDGDEGDDDVD